MLFLGCTGAVCLTMLMIQIDLVQVIIQISTLFLHLHHNQIQFQLGSRFGGATGIDILWILGNKFGAGKL